MLLSLLIAASAPDPERIERPIAADPVPLAVATRGLIEDAPRLEYEVRELLACDRGEPESPRLCYSTVNLHLWRPHEEAEERKVDQLMEEAIDQAKEEADRLPW